MNNEFGYVVRKSTGETNLAETKEQADEIRKEGGVFYVIPIKVQNDYSVLKKYFDEMGKQFMRDMESRCMI